MGQRALIDTNAAIDYLAGILPQNGINKIDQLFNTEKANISIIVKIELLSFNPPNPNDLKMVEAFIKKCTVLPLTDAIANRAIFLRKQHRKKLPDTIIAATALEYELELLSRNVSDFSQLAGLTIINPHTL